MSAMRTLLINDELWAIVAPLLPPESPNPHGGRPRTIADRTALTGIVFVLKGGIPWEVLPQELGYGSGTTCWRRLREWQRADVWRCLHQARVQRLQHASRIDWERASLDSASVPAPGGGGATGKNPTKHGKLGTKRHIVVDQMGVPLAITISAANVLDAQRLEATVDASPSLRLAQRRRGRPRQRPAKLHADKGYEDARCRRAGRSRGITPRIARRGIESSERPGRQRWVVERTLSWLNRFRRLKVRYERRGEMHHALLTLGCALLCWTVLAR
jgi:transposase